MKRIKIKDNVSFVVDSPDKGYMKLSKFLNKLNKTIDYIKTTYNINENAILIYLDTYEDPDCDIYSSFHLLFERDETDKEMENRLLKSKEIKERAINSLKTLIDNNSTEAIKYLKEKKLI